MSMAIEETPLENWLGFSTSNKGNERVYSIRPTDEHIGNPLIRALHGGVVATFLEYAAYHEVKYILNSDTQIEPININVDFLKTIQIRELHASIRITKLGRRVTVADVHAWQENASVAIVYSQGR